MDKQFLTPEGFEKLKAEINFLKTVKRKELADRIQEAKELGDLSENAEYQEAKNEQSFVEGRVVELESILKNAVVITPSNSNLVQVGSTVEVEINNNLKTFCIVGSNEADPVNGRVSNVSPLGQAFLGKQVGEKVMVKTPSGEMEAKIISIK
ncbi:MAG: transcription elongation factor GreA [Candidatus Kerfeldbacteria bacterium CG08_land_8_20_14_0_20_43_14]|uniref:Transcription elongation factor GreA n=1 Tax=Candidatus Kerfeldbacteria bacterium CG08_land_8_20_14_0_20_43_14 TaxID=2014246 RepID=A0A2H0YR03_9BACT|nr:MAG: transcription elongation factor GreA [Candidatus Kerfeldbacteria bacterium CG08_land_8_20_14_0_20_43_14]